MGDGAYSSNVLVVVAVVVGSTKQAGDGEKSISCTLNHRHPRGQRGAVSYYRLIAKSNTGKTQRETTTTTTTTTTTNNKYTNNQKGKGAARNGIDVS